MSKYWIPVVLAVSLALVGADAKADISSTFSAGLEGWTGTGGTVSWVSSGGNPGGYLSQTDTTAGSMYVTAPAAFVGDLSAYDGGTLSFDVIELALAGNLERPEFGTVLIASGTTSASYDLVGAGGPTTSWAGFSVALDAATWGVDGVTWSNILGNVTSIDVILEQEEFFTETTGFDNFNLAPKFIPEPTSLALLGLGLAGVAAWTVRRRRKMKDA